MKNEMILSFSASLENEPFARTCVASFIASLNPTIDEIVEVKTIVGEAVSNAIIHGYNCNEDQSVLIKVTIHDRTLMIKVEDEGNGIENIEEAKQPMFTSKKELEHAGMGLSIIEALCDKMEICSYVGFGTQLIMIKEFHDEKRRND